MPGDLPYVQRLNRSFRMKRIGGSTALHHVGGASAARARKDLTLPPPTICQDLMRLVPKSQRDTGKSSAIQEPV